MDKPGTKRKISVAMRGYEPDEAFRRAVGRYRDDMDGRTEPEPMFTVKLVGVEWCHNIWKEGPYFQWEFEVTEFEDLGEFQRHQG